MGYKKKEIIVDFSKEIAVSNMTKDATMKMDKSEAMKFNEFLKSSTVEPVDLESIFIPIFFL